MGVKKVLEGMQLQHKYFIKDKLMNWRIKGIITNNQVSNERRA